MIQDLKQCSVIKMAWASSAVGRVVMPYHLCCGRVPRIKVEGIQFIVLYPQKHSHDLPRLAGLYTRKSFQYPEGYSRATGSI